MMSEFERQSGMNEMKQEMIDDVMDDVLAGDAEEEETAEIVDKVMAEIGINFEEGLASAPMGKRKASGSHHNKKLLMMTYKHVWIVSDASNKEDIKFSFV